MGQPCLLVHINDLKTICDDEIYVDDTSVWEACDKCGENSNIETLPKKLSSCVLKITYT